MKTQNLGYETREAVEVLNKAYRHAMANEKYDLALEATNRLDKILLDKGLDITQYACKNGKYEMPDESYSNPEEGNFPKGFRNYQVLSPNELERMTSKNRSQKTEFNEYGEIEKIKSRRILK